MAVGGYRAASICARPSERYQRQGSVARSHQLFLQAPDLAYSPKIEIFHRGNRTALFVSSDATRCADHYGMLRYGRLQRVVSRLQVKVWSALAAGHRVGESEREWSSMGYNWRRNFALL